MKYITLNPKFVDKIPEIIENGNIYISIPFNIAIHKCCCGCGNEGFVSEEDFEAFDYDKQLCKECYSRD